MDACACASDGVTIDMKRIAANFRTESDMGSSWLERLPLADQILLRRAPAGGGLLRRRIDDRAVPMLDQFAVAHAERIEGEHLVPGARSGGGILAVVSVHDGLVVRVGKRDAGWAGHSEEFHFCAGLISSTRAVKNRGADQAFPGTFCSIHPRITSNTCRRLFSSIMKWPLPRMPRPFSCRSSASHPACLRNATTAGPCVRPERSAVTNRIGMPARFFSLRGAAAICDGSETGGSYAIGTSVNPHGVPGPNGVPAPSTITIALTSAGRSLATIHPNGPPAEWT